VNQKKVCTTSVCSTTSWRDIRRRLGCDTLILWYFEWHCFGYDFVNWKVVKRVASASNMMNSNDWLQSFEIIWFGSAVPLPGPILNPWSSFQAPYLIYVEVLECENAHAAPVPSKILENTLRFTKSEEDLTQMYIRTDHSPPPYISFGNNEFDDADCWSQEDDEIIQVNYSICRPKNVGVRQVFCCCMLSTTWWSRSLGMFGVFHLFNLTFSV
jgi:hypothetical protein